MKNFLVLVLLTLVSTVSATTYYIGPSGNDNNSGSSSSPWKTLAFACTKVTLAGDVIHVNSGTYYETSQSRLAAGVSIEGSGTTSIIKSHVKDISTILLSSPSQGTNGNQHISNIVLDGDALSGSMGILVERRKNVSVHDCTISNFNIDGVAFSGDTWGSDTEPTTYATGNMFYNNIITNSAGYVSGCCGYGNLRVDGQQDILIHDNVINQTARAAGSNGCCMKPCFTKGMKIYNNTLTTDQRVGYEDANSYNFAIELWNGHGTEIYNNNIYGTIDLGGRYEDKGAYDYGVAIHNNYIGSIASTPVYLMAIDLEPDVSCDEIRIYSNLIKNVNQGINFLPTAGAKYSNVKVYYNIFDQIGHNQSSWGTAPAYAFSSGSGTAGSITNFYFINNTFNMSSYSGALQANAIELPCKEGVPVSYFYIQNNIMTGCDAPAIESKKTGTIDHLWITNNILYNNVSSNEPLMHTTVTNYIYTSNLKLNPLFVSSSDFHLQAGSPAIGKGVKVTGFTNDYDGNKVTDPPCIGAYEYVSPATPSYQNSVIENTTPSYIDITYNLGLANIIPATSSFSVLVNSVQMPVTSISISGTKVELVLSNAVKFSDVVVVSYTKPGSNALQTSTGGIADNFALKSVTNNCRDLTKANDPPVVLINYPKTAYAGFINEIDASSSYDPNNDPLTAEWIVPGGVPVSALKSLKTQFLAPYVTSSQVADFNFKVSDGVTVLTNDIPITILPYKPGLATAKITAIEASNSQSTDDPSNIMDGNLSTKWSAAGDNQYLLLTLSEPFKISHLVMAFLQGQTFESYFDIYASKDNINWDFILKGVASCKFSGDRQVFDFPEANIATEYSYVKFVGHGNSLDDQNYLSEIKIAGYNAQTPGSPLSPLIPVNPISENKENIPTIYPNPAHNYINVSSNANTNTVRIIDYSGVILYEDQLNQGMNRLMIPDSIYSGIYIVEFRSGTVTLESQKLVINR